MADKLVQFTISTSSKNALKSLDEDLSAFERVVRSATTAFDYFSSGMKSIDKQKGFARQSFVVNQEDYQNVLAALSSKSAALSVRRGYAYNVSAAQMEALTMTKEIVGRKAQSKAVEEIGRLGGTAVVDEKNPDKMRLTLPYSNPFTTAVSAKDKTKAFNEAIPEALKASRAEKRRQQRQMNYEEAVAKKNTEDAKDKSRADAEEVILKGILGVLVVTSDIVRRLLTAVLSRAKEADRIAVEAHSVNVTSSRRREMDLFDMAHGLDKGSTFGAIQSVQKSFGDITNLDEKALGTLARVMGSEVADLVRSGIGGKNPEQLLDRILDKYFKQFLSGRNSLGMSVGMEQAARELITVLQGVSPEIARLFARMVDDYGSGFYGRFENTKEWRGATSPELNGKVSSVELKHLEEIGKQYNQILAILEALKSSIFVRLANSLDTLAGVIKNSRVGMSKQDSLELDRENLVKNELAMKQSRNRVAVMKSTSQRELDRLSLPGITRPTGTANERKMAELFHFDLPMLAQLEAGTLKVQDIMDNPELSKKYGIDEALKRFKNKGEVKVAFQRRATDMQMAAKENSKISDEFFRTLAEVKYQQGLAKELNKKPGDNVSDLTRTEAQQTVAVKEEQRDYYNDPRTKDPANDHFEGRLNRRLAMLEEWVQDDPSIIDNVWKHISESKSEATRQAYKKLYGTLAGIMKEQGKDVGSATTADKMKAIFSTPEVYTYFSAVDSKKYNKYFEEFFLDRPQEQLDSADSRSLAYITTHLTEVIQEQSLRDGIARAELKRNGTSSELVIKFRNSATGEEREVGKFMYNDSNLSDQSMEFALDAKGNIQNATAN